MRASSFLSATLTVCVAITVQAQSPSLTPGYNTAESPAGRWIAEHPSNGGIASWWDFRYDGTLLMFYGVATSFPIERSGDTFTSPASTVGAPPVQNRYTIQNEILTIATSSADPAGGGAPTIASYSRIFPMTDFSDPLLGAWRPIPHTPANASNPNDALLQRAMTTAGAIFFTRDNREFLRLPLGTRPGYWNALTRTFHVDQSDSTFTFERKGQTLLLSQPPDGKNIDSYILDPVTTGRLTQTSVPQAQQSGAYIQGQGPGIVMPKLLNTVEPAYTEEARRRKINGTVTVTLIVEPDGTPRNILILKSAAGAFTDSVDRNAAMSLDSKAIEAVQKYRFTPGTKDGKPAPIQLTVEVNFRIF